jgi:hypothetical protein
MLWIVSAAASPPYPEVLAAEAGSGCEPACTVCHSAPSGGAGTATTELAVELQALGLTGGADVEAAQIAVAAWLEEGDAGALCGGDGPVYGCAVGEVWVSVWGVVVVAMRWRVRKG